MLGFLKFGASEIKTGSSLAMLPHYQPSTGGSVRTRLARTAALVSGIAAVLAGAACSEKSAHRPAAASLSTPSRATPAAVGQWQDPTEVLQADGVKVWAATSGHSGGSALAIGQLPPTDTLLVAIECQGTGTLTVEVVNRASSSQPCTAQATLTVNTDEVPATRPNGELKITAGPGLRWAVAIGTTATKSHAQ